MGNFEEAAKDQIRRGLRVRAVQFRFMEDASSPGVKGGLNGGLGSAALWLEEACFFEQRRDNVLVTRDAGPLIRGPSTTEPLLN